MKRLKIISVLTIAAVFSSVLIINSCSKQEMNENAQNEQVNQNPDFAIFNKIDNFRKKLEYIKEYPEYKAGEVLCTDSALWLMEGAMNLTYGFPDEQYIEFKTDSAFLTLVKNSSGDIDINEVSDKYLELIEQARSLYYGSGYENKGLFVLDLEKDVENNNEVIFKVTTVTGVKGTIPPPPQQWEPFDVGEDWYYGEDEGGCFDNNADLSDAAHELAEFFDSNEFEECEKIANPITVTVKRNPNIPPQFSWLRIDNDPLNNYMDYYVFSVSTNVEPFYPDTALCVRYYEMNSYYFNLKHVINVLAREHFNIGEDLDFLQITDVDGDSELFGDDEYTHYFHKFDLYYGNKYSIPSSACNSLGNIEL